MKNIGETLQSILRERHLNQIQAAQKTGLTRVWFNKIIHKDDLACSTLEKICYGLDIHPAIFFDARWTADTPEASAMRRATDSETNQLRRENELLKKLLDEKERTISILLGEYPGQKQDNESQK